MGQAENGNKERNVYYHEASIRSFPGENKQLFTVLSDKTSSSRSFSAGFILA